MALIYWQQRLLRTLLTGHPVHVPGLVHGPMKWSLNPKHPWNRMRGTVQLVEYVGKEFEVLVRVAGTENTQLLIHSEKAPALETSIDFGVRPDRLLLFPFDADSDSLLTTSRALPALQIKGGATWQACLCHPVGRSWISWEAIILLLPALILVLALFIFRFCLALT